MLEEKGETELTFGHPLHPVLPLVEVGGSVIVVDEGRAGVAPIIHPTLCTCLRHTQHTETYY